MSAAPALDGKDGVIRMSLNYLEKYRNRRQQAGITTLGLVILVIFIGLFAFAGIRLTPVYLNYMKVEVGS